MNLITKYLTLLLYFLLSLLLLPDSAKSQSFFDGYLTPDMVNEHLQDIHQSNRNTTAVHTIAQSPGGRDLLLLEIGPETGSEEKSMPAILVVANMEGVLPVTTEAALKLAGMVIEEDAAEDKTWYILANGNPDAAARFFDNPLKKDVRNDLPHNDDKDDQIGEDGPEDLNEDGYVAMMRWEDPLGEWMPVEGDPRLMKKADRTKGERGIYKLHSEGMDNDSDGAINEDPPGGVSINRNFPHLFKDFTATGGAWSGSTPEVYGMFEFVFSHPEIAMTLSLGETNFSMNPPKGGRQGTADFENIQIPESFADQIGADPNKTYSMDEVIRLVQPIAPPGFEITESVVASFLGLGAVVNPMQEDLAFYNELSDQYKEFLEEAGISTERLSPAAAKDGSFELWSYYHIGVPTFSLDFWTLPEFKEETEEEGSGITAESIGEMTNEEFVALGEEKIAMFLEEVNAPDQFSAQQVINMVEGGMITTERISSMLQQSSSGGSSSADGASTEDKALIAHVDEVLGGEGFIEWSEFEHPDLGTVQIGGAVPFVRNTPPASMVDSLLSAQLPWAITLSEKIARLSILKTEVKPKGAGMYELSVWVENENYLPFPTEMGVRNENPRPAILTLEADNLELISGLKRTPFDSIKGHEVKKFSWMVQSTQPKDITITLETTHAWGDTAELNIGDQ